MDEARAVKTLLKPPPGSSWHPEIAGTAPAPLARRLAFGGLAAPLVRLGGSGTPVPLGMVTVACGTLAVIVYAMRLHARVAEHTVATGRPIDRVTANS